MKKRPLANVDWRKYFSPDNITVNEYLYDYGDKFINQTLSKISKAHSKGIPSIILIEFSNSEIVSVLEKKDYLLALQRLLGLCELLEKYEICAKIVDYQKSIQYKTKIKQRKTHKVLTTNK